MKYLFISVLFIVACSQPKGTGTKNYAEKIKSISVIKQGGQMGYRQSVKITTDSLYFDFGLAVDSTKRRNEKKSNDSYQLEDFLSPAELNEFSKIKGGESRQPVDGTDTEITIETEKKSYSVINAEVDNVWSRVLIKMDSISNIEFKIAN